MKKNVEIKKSRVQGKGVYAKKDFAEGEVILAIDDSHVVKDPSKLSQKQYEFDCDYLAGGKIILMQPPEKYINHSCDPNAFVKTIKGIRKLIARRMVAQGEEITFDYAMNGDNEGTFPCRCGSPRCRKVYQGSFFKLPKETQKEYLPYLEDWFVKEHHQKIEALKKELSS